MRPILLLTLLALLTGCRYTFVPLVPPLVSGSVPVRLSADLRRDGDDLLLGASLDDAQARGYLSVVWFLGSAELARDSAYLDARGQRASFRLPAPERASGYRVVLSFEGAVLRQLEYSDPAPK